MLLNIIGSLARHALSFGGLSRKHRRCFRACPGNIEYVFGGWSRELPTPLHRSKLLLVPSFPKSAIDNWRFPFPSLHIDSRLRVKTFMGLRLQFAIRNFFSLRFAIRNSRLAISSPPLTFFRSVLHFGILTQYLQQAVSL
jgi:hypothetical protein